MLETVELKIQSVVRCSKFLIIQSYFFVQMIPHTLTTFVLHSVEASFPFFRSNLKRKQQVQHTFFFFLRSLLLDHWSSCWLDGRRFWFSSWAFSWILLLLCTGDSEVFTESSWRPCVGSLAWLFGLFSYWKVEEVLVEVFHPFCRLTGLPDPTLLVFEVLLRKSPGVLVLVWLQSFQWIGFSWSFDSDVGFLVQSQRPFLSKGSV